MQGNAGTACLAAREGMLKQMLPVPWQSAKSSPPVQAWSSWLVPRVWQGLGKLGCTNLFLLELWCLPCLLH